MNLYSFSLLCFGFCSFLVGLLIWLKRLDAVGKIYFLFTIFNSLWGVFFGIFLNQVDYAPALFYVRLADTFALFIPPTWFHFTLVFAGKTKRYSYILAIVYLLAVSAAFFGFSEWFISGLRSGSMLAYFTCPGVIFHFLTLTFVTIVPAGFFLLLQKRTQSAEKEKTQLTGFVIATALGFLGGGLTIPLSYGFIIPQHMMFLMPFYPFITAYFLIRKGLFDIEELALAAHRDKLTAIGVLAASINHEVKNPLFVIRGLAESCLERQKEGIFQSEKKALESANDAMKRSMEQADRAMDIIKRLSLFAKAGIDSEIKFESVQINEVIENILPLVRYELAEHNIILTREIPKNLPDVLADRRYLEEILFNLLVNAAQAIKSSGQMNGEIKVNARTDSSSHPVCHIGLASHTPNVKRVSVTVEDNGPGIPGDKLAYVFRPFYTTKEEGTGLGLYITQQLVEKISGQISVRSELGSGTVFTLFFPQKTTLDV